MTSQVLGLVLLGAALLVCLMLLLEALTNHALESRLRQQAEERRRLNEEWAALRTARRQQGQDPTDDDLHGVAVADPSDSAALSSAKTKSGPISAGPSGAVAGSFQRSQKSGKPRLSAAREQGLDKDRLAQATLPITIYLSDESAHEQVEAAVEDLLVATGGHIDHRDDPVLGS
ncbi:MAG: hypothetical protein ACRDS9_10995 [Pseudonocardiaceae bacterium]